MTLTEAEKLQLMAQVLLDRHWIKAAVAAAQVNPPVVPIPVKRRD